MKSKDGFISKLKGYHLKYITFNDVKMLWKELK